MLKEEMEWGHPEFLYWILQFLKSIPPRTLAIARLFRFYRIYMFPIRVPSKLHVVTGADSSHEKSLNQLLDSLARSRERFRVTVYDLGMSPEYLTKLKSTYSKMDIKFFKFTFEDRPKWMDINNSLNGAFAWKSQILCEVFKLIRSEKEFAPQVLWLDAGNKVIGNLRMLKKYIAIYGFYSPMSIRDIGEYSHETTMKQFDLSKRSIKKNVMLTGGIIAFDLRNERADRLFTDYLRMCSNENVIKPAGANFSNHRFDQSVLSLCAIKHQLQPHRLIREGVISGGILVHQDIEKFLSS